VSRVSASGGQSTLATKLEKGQTTSSPPRFIPGRQQFLYIVNGVDPSIWLGSLDGAGLPPISSIAVGTIRQREYLAPGWLVRGGWACWKPSGSDVDLGQLSGDPIRLDGP